MERANQALRRSSVKLKCLNSGHSDLNMIISDVTKMRSAFKTFHLAQVTTWEDMAKWANKEKTLALQEIFHFLLELCYLWSEVQLEFIAGLKKFKHQFELILESELLLDKSKSHLTACEHKDNKVKKELKKATTKGNIDEAKQLTERQLETQALVSVAQSEVKSKTLENESIKLMLAKDGLLNLSSTYLELSKKASIIFQAHKDVSRSLPDIHDKNIEDIRYPGSEVARNIVLKTKESIQRYKKSVEVESAPPPPYSRSPVFHLPPNAPEYSPDGFHNDQTFSHEHLMQAREPVGFSPELRPTNYPPEYDLPPRESLSSLDGAVGGLSYNDNSPRRYQNI
uniref:Unkown protein n=1 Tax=Riptortus pedestris TaxID=329032 RepID=R4WQW6_RIPPE|nr:unkown protein [Riptortus pedestris]